MSPPLRRVRPERWILVALLLAWVLWRIAGEWGAAETPDVLPPGKHFVERVVDGDTLLLSGGARVRLIGVDTPETVHPDLPPQPGGKEASEFTRHRVEGREVELAFDRERQDRHGRFLAYATIDGTLLNEELIRLGYGRATLQYNYSDSMKRRFREAQDQAKRERLGIWSQPLGVSP